MMTSSRAKKELLGCDSVFVKNLDQRSGLFHVKGDL
jgi:hypothetical protein